MNVLITGGAGFIGINLTQKLILEGHKIKILDRFSSDKKNLPLFTRNFGKISLIKADITKDKIEKHFEGVDWVFHLAGKANKPSFAANPLIFHKVHVDGTIAVLEASRRVGIKKFVYSSSAAFYSKANKYPTAEDAIIEPRYPYALTKYLGEVYTINWGKIYKLPVVSLRPFSVYGPKEKGAYGALLSIFISQKLAGLPFTVVGDGIQTRDFVYISDVVEAFIAAAKSNISNEIFNVGSGKKTSINKIVKILGGKVKYISKRYDEAKHQQADITKIKKMLGWKPKVTIEEGIEKILSKIY